MKIDNLNLTTLKYFLDTVEMESLTKAASINFVTRPAISQALFRLEEWAGKKLITHEKKSFQLTKDGQDFYRKAKKSYQIFKDSIEGKDFNTGSIKIGCSVSLADLFLIPALPKLAKINSVEIKTGTSSHLKSLLNDKVIHMAIVLDDMEIPNFRTEIIHKGSFVLASKSGIMESNLITTEERKEVIELHRHFVKKQIHFQNLIKAESWSLCIKLALAMKGMCLIPDIMVQKPLKAINSPGFKYAYNVILASHRTELISEAELNLREILLQK